MFLELLFAGVVFEASASAWQISTDGSTIADYGGEACYSCSIQNLNDVVQVTWQRRSKARTVENLASFSHRFSQHVNEPYREKVTFTKASLNSTSIAVKNVTWGDEGCYVCMFHAFPHGTEESQTCLSVQGISEVKTHAQVLTLRLGDDNMAVVFSCSATGRPAPTVQWSFSPGASRVDQQPTTTAWNSDNTSTSSSNITLRVSPRWDGHVECVVNAETRGHRVERVPFSLPAGAEEDEEGAGRSQTGHVAVTMLVITALVVSSIVAVVLSVVMKERRLKWKRRDENI